MSIRIILEQDMAILPEQEINRRDFTSLFPFELCLEIFKHLNQFELIRCGLVSRQWKEICRNDALWKSSIPPQLKSLEGCNQAFETYLKNIFMIKTISSRVFNYSLKSFSGKATCMISRYGFFIIGSDQGWLTIYDAQTMTPIKALQAANTAVHALEMTGTHLFIGLETKPNYQIEAWTFNINKEFKTIELTKLNSSEMPFDPAPFYDDKKRAIYLKTLDETAYCLSLESKKHSITLRFKNIKSHKNLNVNQMDFADQKLMLLSRNSSFVLCYDLKGKCRLWRAIKQIDLIGETFIWPYLQQLILPCLKVIALAALCFITIKTFVSSQLYLLSFFSIVLLGYFIKSTNFHFEKALLCAIKIARLTFTVLITPITRLIPTEEGLNLIQKVLFEYQTWRLNSVQSQYALEKQQSQALIPLASTFTLTCPISGAPIRYPVKFESKIYDRPFLAEWLAFKGEFCRLREAQFDQDLYQEINNKFLNLNPAAR